MVTVDEHWLLTEQNYTIQQSRHSNFVTSVTDQIVNEIFLSSLSDSMKPNKSFEAQTFRAIGLSNFIRISINFLIHYANILMS